MDSTLVQAKPIVNGNHLKNDPPIEPAMVRARQN
jgi:hypothetical protein